MLWLPHSRSPELSQQKENVMPKNPSVLHVVTGDTHGKSEVNTVTSAFVSTEYETSAVTGQVMENISCP